jgi:hypothetical protein
MLLHRQMGALRFAHPSSCFASCNDRHDATNVY